jgi:hypothetical protein
MLLWMLNVLAGLGFVAIACGRSVLVNRTCRSWKGCLKSWTWDVFKNVVSVTNS